MTPFNNSCSDEIEIKAKDGKISKAVDTEETVKNRLVIDAKIKNIRIGIGRITNEEGRILNLSSIEII